MKGLIKLLGLVVATSLCLAILTEYDGGAPMNAKTVIWGLPVVSVAQVDAFGWLALGQAASGVLVIAQGGAGLVTIAQGGVGALFGIGQGMVGLAAIAQIGFGPFFFVGQVGFGAQALGQGVFKRRPKQYFDEMAEEMEELLRPPFGGRSGRSHDAPIGEHLAG